MTSPSDGARRPAQPLTDDWASTTDEDPDLARATRAALAMHGTPAAMTHDAGNRFGRLVAVGGARRWDRL
jgi:hypothetical protein